VCSGWHTLRRHIICSAECRLQTLWLSSTDNLCCSQQYSLWSSVSRSLITACCALSPASLSLKVKVHFCTGNSAAALSLLALLPGILLSSGYSCSILTWARHEPQSSSLALSNLLIYVAFLQPHSCCGCWDNTLYTYSTCTSPAFLNDSKVVLAYVPTGRGTRRCLGLPIVKPEGQCYFLI
jgi:hypothetical protein